MGGVFGFKSSFVPFSQDVLSTPSSDAATSQAFGLAAKPQPPANVLGPGGKEGKPIRVGTVGPGEDVSFLERIGGQFDVPEGAISGDLAEQLRRPGFASERRSAFDPLRSIFEEFRTPRGPRQPQAQIELGKFLAPFAGGRVPEGDPLTGQGIDESTAIRLRSLFQNAPIQSLREANKSSVSDLPVIYPK